MAFALIIPIVNSTGDYVFQRRTDDAPTDAGLLGLFGGSIETDETPLEAAFRELKEETSLDVSVEDLQLVIDADMPTLKGPIHAHVFTVSIRETTLEVYEGTGFEVLSKDAFLKRVDTSKGARHLLALMG